MIRSQLSSCIQGSVTQTYTKYENFTSHVVQLYIEIFMMSVSLYQQLEDVALIVIGWIGGLGVGVKLYMSRSPKILNN